MLTPFDDYPIHQTPEPVAYAGTDRNFYDRYFFNGYSPDGAVYFARNSQKTGRSMLSEKPALTA